VSPVVSRRRVLQVIVTSHLFPKGKFALDRLKALSALVGRDKLVVDVRQVIPSRPTYSLMHSQLSTKGRKMVGGDEQMAGHHRYGGVPRYQDISGNVPVFSNSGMTRIT
jgi:hypothetical protein